jgi:hypothetical protein
MGKLHDKTKMVRLCYLSQHEKSNRKGVYDKRRQLDGWMGMEWNGMGLPHGSR